MAAPVIAWNVAQWMKCLTKNPEVERIEFLDDENVYVQNLALTQFVTGYEFTHAMVTYAAIFSQL